MAPNTTQQKLTTLPAELLTLIIVQLPWPSQHALAVAFPALAPHLTSQAVRKTRYLNETYESVLKERLRASWMEAFGNMAMRPQKAVDAPRIPLVMLQGYFTYLDNGDADAQGETLVNGDWLEPPRSGSLFLMQQGEKNWGMTKSPILQDTLLLPRPSTLPEERELKLVIFAFGEVIFMSSWEDATHDTVENLMLEVGRRFLKRWREIDFATDIERGVVFQTYVVEGGMLTMNVWGLDEWLKENVGKEAEIVKVEENCTLYPKFTPMPETPHRFAPDFAHEPWYTTSQLSPVKLFT